MRFPGFIGPTYKLRSPNVDCQRCINLYPELDETHMAKEGEIGALVGTPGLKLLATLGDGPIRGVWYTSNGKLYVVSGSTLYKVASDWTHTTIGTLQTSTGQVSMADNGAQLVVVDGPNGYWVKLSDETFTQIDDDEWLGSNRVTYQDGYFIFVKPDSQQFYLSDLNDITFSDPANTNAEGAPDNIVGHISVHRNLWLLGENTTEIFYNSGDSVNPFQRIDGSFMEYGCAAKFSIAKMANSLFWLGRDASGQGMVVLANGYAPQRISTHAVEQAIQKYSDISDAVAFTYQENGHHFYVLSFPTGDATWVYDTATNLWHERAYLKQGGLKRHRANCHAFAYGKHVVGDYENGKLYEMSLDNLSDAGAEIARIRVLPHLSKSMKRIFYNSFQLDIESGTGIDGTGQGTDPQVMLQWSDDGGHTWKNEHWRGFGKIGQTRRRCIWRQLGSARDRVFRVKITDPVKVTMIGAELEFKLGTS